MINTIVLAVGRIDAPAYTEVSIWVIGLHMGGNAAEHMARRAPVVAGDTTLVKGDAVVVHKDEQEGN